MIKFEIFDKIHLMALSVGLHIYCSTNAKCNEFLYFCKLICWKERVDVSTAIIDTVQVRLDKMEAV